MGCVTAGVRMRPFWLDELAGLRQSGHLRKRKALKPDPGNPARVFWHGHSLVLFASNDYLGLSRDPRLAQAAIEALRRDGAGAGASPLVSGWLPQLRALERELACLKGTGGALVFSSGFAANLAAVASLAGPGDLILSDALNHASLIDGCRLSRASVIVYRHGDASHALELAAKHRSEYRRLLVVTDSIFSMEGDTAPLAELADLVLQHDGRLLVDEAHATGVLGEGGSGLARALCAKLAGQNNRLVQMGTLSKALGSQGGYVAGSPGMVRWLVNRGRSYLFSTALAPAGAGAARAALRLLASEPWRRDKVLGLATRLRQRLADEGIATVPGQAAIVPIVVGDASRAVAWSHELATAGFLVPAIRPPSVPQGASRLRVSLTALLDNGDVDGLALELGRMYRRDGLATDGFAEPERGKSIHGDSPTR